MPDRMRSTAEVIHKAITEFLEERATHHDRMVNVVGKPLKDDHRELAEAYRQRLATLSTPREPEPVAWMVKHEWSPHWSFLENRPIPQMRNSAEWTVTPLYRSSSPYTDEDGHQRCHLGGCRVEPVSSDEGTCYYRVVGDGDE